jgi:glycosyltransferase involved in cell wall biosynthesis
MKKKKILFFGKLPPPYIGPSVATKIILNSGLKKYYNIVHFDTSHHRTLDQLGKFSLKNLFFPFFLYMRLVFYLIKFSPDVVYVPSQQTTIAYLRDIPFYIIAKLFRKKIVCHLRGGYFLSFYNECNFLMKFIVEAVQKIIDAQIVLGNNLIYLYEDFMNIDKIFVVPNGRDFVYNKNFNDNEERVNVLFLGNLIRQKGIIDFINAGVDILNKGYDNVTFQFAGNHYDCKEEIENLMSNNCDLNIFDKGPVYNEDKIELINNSDIFVFPTYYRNEGHPWVIVEALAAGMPIISTDWGAIAESVIDGENGFIVNPKDPDSISSKIERLIKDKKLRFKMGQKSQSLYKDKFTQKKLVENLKHVFDTVLLS